MENRETAQRRKERGRPEDEAVLLCLPSLKVMGERLARLAGIPLQLVSVAAFPDGESTVTVPEGLRGRLVFLLASLTTPVNDQLMALALAADGAKAAEARALIALIPYLGYARQDRRSRVGEPRSAQVVAKVLAAVGIDRLITVDIHSPALESAFPMPMTSVPVISLFAPIIRSWGIPNFVVVSPDAGGLKRAQTLARELGARTALVLKERRSATEVATFEVLGDVRGKPCLLIDDMVSTGKTLARAAAALEGAGATSLYAAFTHPVLAPGALETLIAVGFERILCTDSVPVATLPPSVEVCSVVSLLSEEVTPYLARDAGLRNDELSIAR